MEGARRAAPGDMAECRRLLDEVRAAGAALRGGPERLADASAELADVTVFAGTLEGEVVGVGAAHVRASTVATGVVDCCYVRPEARGVGVGAALVAAMLDWFSESGCAAVDAPALPGDRETKRLLEAEGFSARLLVMHRRLP